jgi:hypothetical protein
LWNSTDVRHSYSQVQATTLLHWARARRSKHEAYPCGGAKLPSTPGFNQIAITFFFIEFSLLNNKIFSFYILEKKYESFYVFFTKNTC